MIPARTVDPALVDADAAGSLPLEHPVSASAPSARTATLDKARFTGNLRSVAGAPRTIRNTEGLHSGSRLPARTGGAGPPAGSAGCQPPLYPPVDPPGQHDRVPITS